MGEEYDEEWNCAGLTEGASNPVAAINTGLAGCQRLSRFLSEFQPLTCVAMTTAWCGTAQAGRPLSHTYG
jgi:hypothetical protein